MVFRVWSVVSGPLNAALVVALLGPAAQGAYYTLTALTRWQSFLELGFGSAVQQLVSHASAADVSVEGAEKQGNVASVDSASGADRVDGLARLAVRWYVFMAVILALVMPVGGYWWLSHQDLPSGWEGPWLLLALATALSVLVLPAWPLLEGTGRVAEVYRFRLNQSMAGRVSGWITLPFAGLWALSVERLVNTALAFGWLRVRQRALLEHLRHTPPAPIRWSETVFPLQWRMALATAGGTESRAPPP
jgi:hypothetical protein